MSVALLKSCCSPSEAAHLDALGLNWQKLLQLVLAILGGLAGGVNTPQALSDELKKKMAADHVAALDAAGFNWLQFAQMLLALLQQLFPQPVPVVTP